MTHPLHFKAVVVGHSLVLLTLYLISNRHHCMNINLHRSSMFTGRIRNIWSHKVTTTWQSSVEIWVFTRLSLARDRWPASRGVPLRRGGSTTTRAESSPGSLPMGRLGATLTSIRWDQTRPLKVNLFLSLWQQVCLYFYIIYSEYFTKEMTESEYYYVHKRTITYQHIHTYTFIFFSSC